MIGRLRPPEVSGCKLLAGNAHSVRGCKSRRAGVGVQGTPGEHPAQARYGVRHGGLLRAEVGAGTGDVLVAGKGVEKGHLRLDDQVIFVEHAMPIAAGDRLERDGRLNHPNVCTLYDVGPNYLVMELVEGPTRCFPRTRRGLHFRVPRPQAQPCRSARWMSREGRFKRYVRPIQARQVAGPLMEPSFSRVAVRTV